MNIKPFIYKFKHLFVPSIFVASFFLLTHNVFADDSDRIRGVWIDNGGSCQTSPLQFVDVEKFSLGDDMMWELDNPVCIAYGVVVGLSSVATDFAQSYSCKSLDPVQAATLAKETAEIAAETASGRFITIKKFTRKISAAKSCTTNTAKCVSSSGSSVLECGIATACCSALASGTVTNAAAVGELAIIWSVAKDSQQNAHICGETWKTWQQRSATSTGVDDFAAIQNYQDGDLPDNQIYVYGATYGGDPNNHNNSQNPRKASYQKYLQDEFSAGNLLPDIKNKKYREYIYGGMELDDNGSDACTNPDWSDDVRNKILGYTDVNQKYYMRGPNETSNYACERFLLYRGTKEEKASAKAAYDCCTKRSQETICIEEKNGSHEFCRLGGPRCNLGNVWYDIYQGKKVANTICAKTYSVCPYNHPLGGGTEIEDLDPKYNIRRNHCQYLKHCVKIPPTPYIRTNNLEGGWISSACFDMKGDSQNSYGYTADLLPINTKHFSAPIAQCFKETLENMLINQAGNTKCVSPDEQPDKDGNCKSGYIYKTGTTIIGEKSFFQKIQDNLRFSIKMVMTVAITVMGIAVLLTGTPWDKKTIIMFIIKIALVSYFALGTAWQDYFFKSVTTASTSLAGVFMKIDEGTDNSHRDGCQFPRRNYAFSGNSLADKTNYDLEYSDSSYPPGKEYLKIWDMLDCKIARAIGFGSEASIPNLIYLILAGLFTGGYGLIFFVATFIFAFYFIALTVRALHIFLISSIAITIMVYVSPITITAWLFEKTKSIFTQWHKNLAGFILQPVILFVYLGILITIFEKTMIGSATFTSADIKMRDGTTVSDNGRSIPKGISCNSYTVNGVSFNPENDSIYCIFRFNNIKSNQYLSTIGIAIPVIINMNSDKMNTIFKAAFLMFIFTKFLDKISEFAVKLVGGSELKSNSPSSAELGGKAFGYAKALQSRGSNATKKWGGKVANKASQVKDFARAIGTKGDGPGGTSR